MKREIIKIDRELCNGCGVCVPNCHEGALQMIDGKATLVSELMCDGLGACIGHCPVGAITIEEREAEPYNEVVTLQEIVKQGKNVVIAHLQHLKEHGQTDYLKEGVKYLNDVKETLPFDLKEVIEKVHNLQPVNNQKQNTMQHNQHEGGCPGSRTMSFNDVEEQNENVNVEAKSELRQWPVQLHLVNPMAGYFLNSDLLVAADCVAFSLGNFHQKFLKGRSLVIACPKLDSNKDVYVKKFESLINDAKVNTITVMIMEVPCCGGLLQMVQMAAENAKRKVPIKLLEVGLRGDILAEEWV